MKKEKRHAFYLGKVEFSGFGGFQEKLVSELLENGIALSRVRTSDGMLYGEISPFDFYTAAKTARRYGVRLRAGKRSGIYFTLSGYKRRVGLYVGLLAFAVLLSFHQSRVSDIKVEGAPEGEVLKILEECGITEGADKSGLALFKAEQRLMTGIEGCSWADVSCIGCRVTAKVETGVPVPEIEDNTKPRNLVASRSAVIVSQKVRRGVSAVGNGSGVPKGGLLVSGAENTTAATINGAETGNILFVRADAEIIGEFTETREFYVPFNETIHTADGGETRFNSLVIGDDVYPLYFVRPFADNAVYSEETRIITFFGEETPFKIRTGIYSAYQDRNITRSGDDCVSELRRLKSDYEENFYSEYEIVGAAERFMPEDEGVRLYVDYTLRGDIAEPQYFEVTVGASEGAEPQQLPPNDTNDDPSRR